jgi:polyisoprenoid-binding protein YceI
LDLLATPDVFILSDSPRRPAVAIAHNKPENGRFMKMRVYRRRVSSWLPLVVLLLIAAASRFASAADLASRGKIAAIELDPAKTTITYSVEGWPHHTLGTFALKHGAMQIDPASGKMNGIITVDAASGNSAHPVRDERMKSSVLEVQRYPEISFAPQQVVNHGNLQAEFPVTVRGVMSLHGTSHTFTIEAVVRRQGDSATIHCDFVIPYVEWGLPDPSILIFKVSKEVAISVTTVARVSWISQ